MFWAFGTALLACLVILVVMPATRMHTASSGATTPTRSTAELEPTSD